MILIISACKEPLSELEFIESLKALVSNSKVVHYTQLQAKDLALAEKIIISGTALADFDYLQADFSWISKLNKPILGICAGAQVIAKAFGWELVDETHIDVKPVHMVKLNLLVKGDFNAYFLHTKRIRGDFTTLAKSGETPALIKHNVKHAYACIFHPEVLNQEIITLFIHAKHK